MLTRSEVQRVKSIHTFFLAKFLKQQKKWNYTSVPDSEIPFVLCLPRFKSNERNLDVLDQIQIFEEMQRPKPVSPLLQQILARHNTDYQQVRDAILSNDANETAKSVMQEIQQAVFKRCVKTRHNNLCYFATEADFTQSPLSNTQIQKKQEHTTNSNVEFERYVEYYHSKGIEILDLTQPLLVIDFRKIAGELDEIPDQGNTYNKLYLVPEHCDILQLTFDMYIYGLFLGNIFQHMEETAQYMRNLDQWQNDIGYSVDNKLLLKQVCFRKAFLIARPFVIPAMLMKRKPLKAAMPR